MKNSDMTLRFLRSWLSERDLTLTIHGATGVAVLYPADDPVQQFTEYDDSSGLAVQKLIAQWDLEPLPERPCCLLAGPGRGDCEHAVGLPGKSIPGQHDGDDDTVDHYGKPNGWCWFCWNRRIITTLEALVGKRGDDLVAQEWRSRGTG